MQEDVSDQPQAKQGSVSQESDVTKVNVDANMGQKPPKDFRYWAIIIALCVTSSLVALEGTVVSTALPSIIRELGGGESYVWVVNAYFLSRYDILCHGRSVDVDLIL